MDIQFIKENGVKLGEGRYREAYELGEYVYKIDNGRTHSSNKSEFEIFNNISSDLFNPIYGISSNGEIAKVDKCVPLEKFITDNRSKVSKGILCNIWSIFQVVKKFELENYMICDINELKEICDKTKLDYDEIIYPLNWAYNPIKDKLVIVDYAE